MPGTACVLCRSGQSTRRGEHVLPQWYLAAQGLGPGPFPWTINGEPILNRRGQPVTLPERVRILLPVCEPCNGELNRRFEVPGRGPLGRLFAARGAIALAGHDLEAVALWFLKTLLLHARPEARYSAPRVDAVALKWTPDELPERRFFDWLVNGSAPPSGLSLWVFRSDEADEALSPSQYTIPLPVATADGAATEFVSFQMTFHGLNVTVVVHPGWAIRHPLEENGQGLLLWPNPPQTGADLGVLPVLPRRTVAWMKCRVRLRPGVLGTSELPPLGHSPHPFAVLPIGARFVESWGF